MKLYALYLIVRLNYAARELGLWPDQWCWADVALLERGYAATTNCGLVKLK